LANVACDENEKTNVRLNEVYLLYRVDSSSMGDFIKVADFARIYEGILGNKEIRGSRVSVHGLENVDELKYKKNLNLGSSWYKNEKAIPSQCQSMQCTNATTTTHKTNPSTPQPASKPQTPHPPN
jgi:hypothetical protein